MTHVAASVVRPPAVAGAFYPADPAKLSTDIRQLLGHSAAPVPRLGWPKALVLPHAGYIYSGAVAAAGYAAWRAGRGAIARVILIGPTHRVPLRGVALAGADFFATPLGRVPVDREAEALLADLQFVVTSPRAHALEHALEVHLPFLQEVLGAFTVVPLAVGEATPDEVAHILERLWGGPETVIALSTDLSHFHTQREAQRLDAHTAERVLALRHDIEPNEACGARPLNGLLLAAQRRGLVIHKLMQCTSGDTAGDLKRVVGYGSFALDEAELAEGSAGRHLIALACQAVAHRLGLAAAPQPTRWWLEPEAATFVTLKRRGALRGCIGTLQAWRSLGADLLANAEAAAFADPRFAPLHRAEWPEVTVEVSVLSAPQALPFATEAELLTALVPGVDGLILESNGKRATFLPQVWEELPDKRAFLTHLRRKAGLASDFPLTRCQIGRYRVAKYAEPEG